MSLRFWRRKPPEGFTRVPRLSAEDVVRACYEAILRREPDATGLAGHAATIATDPAALPRVLREFLAQPESIEVNAALLLEALGPVRVPVVSLGTHCYTSEFLKRQGMRPWAGPFDWIFSSVAMVEHCIRDDFAAFLDRSQYRPIPLAERVQGPRVNRVDHAFYLDKFQVRHVFNHHDVHEDEDYAYITRCVERFRAALRTPEPALFLLCCRVEAGSLAALRALADAVADASPAPHRVLAIRIDTTPAGRLVPEARVEHEDERMRVLRLASVSAWQPLAFADPIDELVLARLVRGYAAWPEAGAAEAAAP